MSSLRTRAHATDAAVHAWLKAAQWNQSCGVVNPGSSGECETDDQGQWSLAPDSDLRHAVRSCLTRCASCARCRFLSVSLNAQPAVGGAQCAWYAACKVKLTDHIGRWFVTGPRLAGHSARSLPSDALLPGEYPKPAPWDDDARPPLLDDWSQCARHAGYNRTGELLRQLLAVRDVLSMHAVRHAALFGTLLGLRRDKGMNPFEADNDVLILDVEAIPPLRTLRVSFLTKGMHIFSERAMPGVKDRVWRVCTAASDRGGTAGRRPPWWGSRHYLPWTDLMFLRAPLAEPRTGWFDGLRGVPYTEFHSRESWHIKQLPLGAREWAFAPSRKLANAFLQHEYGRFWREDVPARPRCSDEATSAHNVAGALQLPHAAHAVARRWVRRAATGYCAATSEATDCETAQMGSWQLELNVANTSWEVAAAACLARCSMCARCRFISLSRRWRDCSWYASCHIDQLKSDVDGFLTGAALGSRAARRMRVAAPRMTARDQHRCWRGKKSRGKR